MGRFAWMVLCITGLAAGACAQAESVRTPEERGLASWYGKPYDGRVSASGAIYNQDELTAAHRTLPFGTLVRVRRLDRHRSVVVRITDRGPFLKGRIIDVSRAAAVRLGLMRPGLAPVELEILWMPPGNVRHRPPADLVVFRKPDEPSRPVRATRQTVYDAASSGE